MSRLWLYLMGSAMLIILGLQLHYLLDRSARSQ